MTTDKTKNFFRVSAEDFKKIPGSPIAYWLNNQVASLLNKEAMGDFFSSGGRFKTCDDELFLRFWWEISTNNSNWHPYCKGGDGRKYCGNELRVVNWTRDSQNYFAKNGGLGNQAYWNVSGLTWSTISTSVISFRIKREQYFNSSSAPTIFGNANANLMASLGYLNSNAVKYLLDIFNPTASLIVADILKLPLISSWLTANVETNTYSNYIISRSDWDSYETSWDFQTNPLLTVGNGLNADGNQVDLSAIYIALRRDWQRQTEEMRRLEIENNRIFIDAYGLQDELSPEVPWNEITLTSNPWYRYGKTVGSEQWAVDSEEMPKEPALEARLREDTIKEFISYAVGCMMGRYSPEKPGLILANQGESFDDFIVKTGGRGKGTGDNKNGGAPESTILHSSLTADHYLPDRDGVIPILDEEWFVDDIVAQFKQFLRFTFGEEHFANNLDFIEKALGKDLRKYFIKDFYKDHIQRYKKRPIYWMFSSPKSSFNALIYMHRYRPDTVSIVLNEYLREFISKIRAKREHLIGDNNRATLSPAEKTRNLKQIDKYAAMLTELDAYERDVLYPLAQEKIAIDLDDGVKVNYVKFGAALKKIPGLEAKEE